jgi:CDP-L-myo-inositol myo-inositolphosphotransferase
MKEAVILCAGLASRMKPYSQFLPKPLIRVAGREIIYRTVKLLQGEGIDRFIFVVNPDNRRTLDSFFQRLGINYELVLNDKPERENGYSLLLAEGKLREDRFVLTMGDHIYSEGFIKKALNKEGLIVDELALFTDREEATKVLCKEGRVDDIGKGLRNFNGYDTGFFILKKDIFEVARRLERVKSKLTLSDIVKEARIECSYVSGEFWTDVDTPEDVERARKEIVRTSVKGTGDGFVSRYLNRKVSLWFSEKLVEHITPNQATLMVFTIGILSSLIALFNPPLGGLLYQLSSMLDGIDGEIARASMRTTKFGGWLDSVLDRYVDFAFLSALALWLKPSLSFLPWVFLTLFGSFMVSYTTERYRGAYCEDAYKVIKALRFLLGKRDERIFLTMVFCLFGWIEMLFIVLALLTNLRTALTIYLVWREKGGE